MEHVKYFFSCILTPITGLMNFGKNIRTADENVSKSKKTTLESKGSCEKPIAIMCAVCTKACSLAMMT